MGIQNPRRWLLLILAAMLTACGGAELPDDGPPPAVSLEAAASFVQKAVLVGERGVQTRQVRFTVTQEEVTSVLNLGSQLAEQAQAAAGPLAEQAAMGELADNPDFARFQGLLERVQGEDDEPGLFDFSLRIRQPHVYFKGDGHVILRGEGRLWRWGLPMRAVLAPRAAGGALELDFVEGQLGSLSLPEWLFDPLGRLLARAILAGREYAEIQEILVSEGALTFAGTLKALP